MPYICLTIGTAIGAGGYYRHRPRAVPVGLDDPRNAPRRLASTEAGMSDDTLFYVEPVPLPEPPEKLSADRRRTLRQLTALRAGTHPLGMRPRILPGYLPLHPDAPAPDDRDATGPRCGNCRFRQTFGYHNRSYAKCNHPGTRGADEIDQHGPPRITHSAASDVRAWWPGCRDWEPGDPALPDAMRWIPDPKEIR